MNENTKNDGGAAFPQAERIGDIATQHGGMTLRDYFAAKAMNGTIASGEKFHNKKSFAEWCYQMADAMIAARGE